MPRTGAHEERRMRPPSKVGGLTYMSFFKRQPETVICRSERYVRGLRLCEPSVMVRRTAFSRYS
ncbi:MAG TPA: hypothetical protein VIO85_09560 [Candidatus Dormibacteraeota bacterium]